MAKSTNPHAQATKRAQISETLRIAVWSKTLGWCWYCGDSLEGRLQVDHVMPVSKGGGNDIDNLVPCCPQCNLAKSNKDIEDFRRELAEDRWPNQAYAIFCGEDVAMPRYSFAGELGIDWECEEAS